ncbi:MAG: winged helix-turn-helix domain-containing protein [Chloroflexi bacterium]|nr:winged helix-turn-helix domain-containing protein [Chloroflexota bacterium]
MSLLRASAEHPEAEKLKQEIEALKNRLAGVSEANIAIAGTPEIDAALQELINRASNLAGARYGALVTFEATGDIRDFYASGVADEDRELMAQSAQVWELLINPNAAPGTVRLNDAAIRPDELGLPQGHPAVETFIGMPIYCQDERVGSLFLADKEAGQEFSREDEHVAAMFAAQAGSMISNSRRYQNVVQERVDLETMMEQFPVSLGVFDVRAGEMSFMNREARRLLGKVANTKEEIENIYFALKFTRPDGRELHFTDLPGTRTLQSGETVLAEDIVMHLPDGTSMTTLVNSAPVFSESGEMLWALSSMQDITALENQEIRRAEFLEMVSAELRTPLISITGSAAALRSNVEHANPTEDLQLLGIIDRQADMMRGQINSLMELAQIHAGTLSVVVEPMDLAGLIERSCAEYLNDHSAIAIQLDIAENLSAVLADQQLIGRVLHNFLRDAAMRSSDSSPVTVSATEVDIHVAVSVSANGPIAPTENNYTLTNANEHPEEMGSAGLAHAKAAELSSQGEGLAFAYCRGVIEAQGGRISTDMDEQEGRMTLTFTLPTIEDEVAVMVPVPAGTPDTFQSAAAEEIKILVATEDPRLSRLVRQDLFDAGYDTVATAALGEIEELASLERPELIILDIAGREEESFRILRGAGQALNLPAIVLCDRDDEEYVVRAFDMGADGYMVKPFSSTELIARIKATLRRLNAGADVAGSRAYQIGDVRINFDEWSVNVSGQRVPLTGTEFKLLTELANSSGRVLTQTELLQSVWGAEYVGESQLLRSYIKSLRQKLGDNARRPSYIFTAHGVGYRMARPNSV